MKKVEREQLISLAKEVNVVLGWKPAINTKAEAKGGLSDKDLTQILKKEVGPDLESEDFTPVEGETKFTEAAADTFAAIGVLVPKKPAEIKKDEKGKKVKDAPKKGEAKPKYTRANAFSDALHELNGTAEKSKLIEVSNQHYVKAGGKDNLKESAWYYNTIVPGLVAMGLASVKDGFLHCRLSKRPAK